VKVLWALYTAVLAYGLTLMPPSQVALAERATDPWSLDPGASARHFLLFFLEGLLSRSFGWDGLTASTVLAGSTELFQTFVPWRTYDWRDLFANFLGALVGFSTANILKNKLKARA